MNARSAIVWKTAVAALVISPLSVAAAGAAETLKAELDLSEQRLCLFGDSELQDVWRVSIARRGYRNLDGNF